ncbi:MAG: hypothetical protein AB1439_04425 [candidate division FCPU426 bacterium]
MSPVLPTRKEDSKRPAIFRRRPGGSERGLQAEAPVAAGPAPEPVRPQTPPAGEAPVWKVQRTRNSIRVEQEVSYHPGAGQPLVSLVLGLTTACRGRRKQDGLTQLAYVLRLEVLSASEGARLEGFKLGPWSAEDLGLETGSIHVAEPVWAAFQPASGRCHGRLLIGDRPRRRLLDLPWASEALVPGAEAVED